MTECCMIGCATSWFLDQNQHPESMIKELQDQMHNTKLMIELCESHVVFLLLHWLFGYDHQNHFLTYQNLDLT